MSKQKQLPDGMSVDSVTKVYLKELDRHSNDLIDEIKSFLTREITTDVKEATVEVFPDEYGDGFVSIGLYLSGNVHTHIPFAEYANDMPLIEVQAYEELVSLPDLFVDLVKQWFAESWWKAGGWEYKLPVTVYGHEDFGNGKSIKLTYDS